MFWLRPRRNIEPHSNVISLHEFLVSIVAGKRLLGTVAERPATYESDNEFSLLLFC